MRTLPLAAVPALLALAAAAPAQTPHPPVLDGVVPQVKAVVRQTQPKAAFASGPDVLIAQYRTANTPVHPHDGTGRSLPPYLELGPRRGGFFLELSVANGNSPTPTQTVGPSQDRPWTTVTTFYSLADGRTLVMTWEAAAGAPHGLARKVGQVLSAYAAYAAQRK